MDEEWRNAVGWEGLYQVSCRGRVKSLGRIVQRGEVQQPRRERILKTFLNRGYETTGFNRDGIKKTKTVHTLVCTAFIGPRPDGMEVRHLNGVRNDNRAENLVYGTQSENQADRIPHGTDNRGENCPSAKLTVDQVREIRRLLETDILQTEIGAMFGVSKTAISDIKSGDTWRNAK